MRDFHLPGRSATYALNGMAATSHPLASQVAVETLKSGGNAVDAALSAAFVLGLAEPQMTGIGGDCFILLKPENSETVIGLNGSGRSPQGFSADRLRADGLATVPIHGIHSVTLPGAVDAFCRLHEDYGSLPLDRILAPAIHYANEGVPVAPRVAFDWADDLPVLQGRDVVWPVFMSLGGLMLSAFTSPLVLVVAVPLAVLYVPTVVVARWLVRGQLQTQVDVRLSHIRTETVVRPFPKRN